MNKWQNITAKIIEKNIKKYSVELLNMRGANGCTDLHRAALASQEPNVISCLLHHGWDANLQITDDGSTPLHLAVEYNTNFVQIIRELLDNTATNPNIQNNKGQTPLHLLAIRSQKYDRMGFILAVPLLVKDKRVDCTITDNDDKTAFDYLVENGFFDGVEQGTLTDGRESPIFIEWRDKTNS